MEIAPLRNIKEVQSLNGKVVDGRVSVGVQGPKGISLLPAIAKPFQSWRRIISLPGRLPGCC